MPSWPHSAAENPPTLPSPPSVNPRIQTSPAAPSQITNLIAEGYPAQQVLLQLQAEVLAAPSDPDDEDAVPAKPRALICELVAESDKCLQDGADEFLQLLHVGAKVQKVLLPA